MLKNIITLTCFFILSATAIADEVDQNIEIQQIGIAPEQDTGFFKPNKTLAVNCHLNVIYFDLTTTKGKSFFTLLTAAKFAGKKLSIISYSLNPDGKCTLRSAAVD